MSTQTDRPESLSWATDDVFTAPGEAWDGQPNKIEPAASKKAEGIDVDEQPDACEWNWWRNAVARFCAFVEGLQLANWFYLEHDTFTSWIMGGQPLNSQPYDICHDPSADLFTAIDHRAVTLISTDPGAFTSAAADHPGGQGELWAEESTTPFGLTLGVAAGSVEIAAYGGQRIVVSDGFTAQHVAESSSVGTWNDRTTDNGVAWHCIDHDGSGLWAIGGGGGKLDTSSSGTSWTDRASGASDTIRLMRHNRLSGSLGRWLALTDTKACRSSDGLTWVASNHSLSGTPLRLDYDEATDTWLAILDNGALARSEDNGATWTETADPFGLAASATLYKYEVGLASDRQSGWVATFERYAGAHPTVTSITSRRWVSKDGGVLWARAYSPDMTGCQRGGVCWGGDRFITCGDSGANYSLRVLGS